jgi:hypothetical protein
VHLDVDLILTWGVTAARIAKEATTSIPIVNGSMSDPVRAKLINKFHYPSHVLLEYEVGQNDDAVSARTRHRFVSGIEFIRSRAPRRESYRTDERQSRCERQEATATTLAVEARHLARVAALATAAPTATFALQETDAAARLLAIELQPVVVHRPYSGWRCCLLCSRRSRTRRLGLETSTR